MATKYVFEYTDTYGGEANYCWVKRGSTIVSEKSDNESMSNFNRRSARAIKKAAGLNGVRGKSYWQGDHYEFVPNNSCTILFADYSE